jgi:lysozyme
LKSLKQKIIAAFFAAGLSMSSAYVAVNLTVPSEGVSLDTYFDPVGIQTYCIGHADFEGKAKESYTEDECVEIFVRDWTKHGEQLDSLKLKFSSEWQRAALTDFTFNVGIGNVRSSTLISLVLQGEHEVACEELSRWVYAGGKKLRGLVTRRKNTIPYCLGEVDTESREYKEFESFWNSLSREVKRGQ